MLIGDERSYRIKKLENLQELHVNPYPSDVMYRTHTCAQTLLEFDVLSGDKTVLGVAGRIRTIRKHGGSIFFTIEDGSSILQLYVRKNSVTPETFVLANELLDMGDFIEARGTLFQTRMGEKTLEVSELRLLTKTIRPLPEKWHGLSDVEIRYRQRYLDLMTNPATRDVFKKRGRIIQTIRSFFDERGFLEVETPMLQPLAGGATARPFLTHHNALDRDLYLRIAPELYLKRLVVGGYERVYELGRCFRNEGIDHSHNPEFTMLEAYLAYASYHDLMTLIEELFHKITHTLFTSDEFEYEGVPLSMKPPFERIPYMEALAKHCPLPSAVYEDEGELRLACKKLQHTIDVSVSRGKILDELTKTYVLPYITKPTFLIDHPTELSPLSKRKEDNPERVERFQLIVANKELVNAFSELNDPLDQRSRFEEQEKHRAKGDQEAHQIDEDYITALEYGLPPTAGLGIGIDRLVALLTNSHSLKEVILFPTLREK